MFGLELKRGGAILCLFSFSCASPGASQGSTGAEGQDDGPAESEASTGEPEPDPDRATVTHSFGSLQLGPFEETQPCVSWTLDNEEPVYINAVTLANQGSWHHSNWFVVPEAMFPGEDGFWNCEDRGFQEITAALSGTVLFAQSTQSWVEVQQLNEGVVVKAPARHKVIGATHALNLAPHEKETELRMSLDIIHPKLVETVLTTLRLNYGDLQIPPQQQSRFSSSCNLDERFQVTLGQSLDMKIHWVLPHYHYLGNFFELAIDGGPNDGQVIYQLQGFNGDANGKAFAQPVDLAGAQGVSFTCGYDNDTDQEVGFGIGDQEMCVALVLADSQMLLDANVPSGTQLIEEVDGTAYFEGDCSVLGLPKNAAQGLPKSSEVAGELYVPPSNADDMGLPPVPECEDTPAGASAEIDATLTSIRDNVLVPTCTFSSCHGEQSAVAGLDLESATLRDELVNHQVFAETQKPLVDPGDADNSWLMDLLAKCEPVDEGGTPRSHMPRNAPVLLEPGLVAAVRDWINAGALDD